MVYSVLQNLIQIFRMDSKLSLLTEKMVALAVKVTLYYLYFRLTRQTKPKTMVMSTEHLVLQ